MIGKISNWIVGTAHAASTTTTLNGTDFFGKFSLIKGTGTSAQSTLSTVIGFVVTWVLAIVGLIAFFYMLSNGIKYITAGGDAAKATEARQGIVNAIIGIIVVVAAYFIVQFAFNLGANIAGGA